MLRRWRGRFGIAAPHVAVRTHVPWHLRAAGAVIGVVLLLGLAGWAFDAGRRIAGLDQNELAALQAANLALEDEVQRLRSLMAASENSLQIEQSATRLLSEKNRALVEENAKLKEELAVIERLSERTGKMGGR